MGEAPGKPALVFDLFGTLVEEFDQARIERLLREVYATCQADPAVPQVHAALAWEEFSQGMMGLYRDRYSEAARTHGRSPQVEEAVHALLTEYGGAAPEPGHIERFIANYAQADRLVAVPRAREVLEALTARGYRLALLSNVFFPGWIYESNLVHLGLIDHLPIRVFSSEYEYMKPHPEIFAEVARRLDHDPAGCVMIGDRLDLDVLGAQAAGWRTVLIDPAKAAEPGAATWVVSGLSDLLPLFP